MPAVRPRFHLTPCSKFRGHLTLLQRWIAAWSDLMAFEIVPVVEGKDTAQALSGD